MWGHDEVILNIMHQEEGVLHVTNYLILTLREVDSNVTILQMRKLRNK